MPGKTRSRRCFLTHHHTHRWESKPRFQPSGASHCPLAASARVRAGVGGTCRAGPGCTASMRPHSHREARDSLSAPWLLHKQAGLCDLPRQENSGCRQPLPWHSGHRAWSPDRSARRAKALGQCGRGSFSKMLDVHAFWPRAGHGIAGRQKQGATVAPQALTFYIHGLPSPPWPAGGWGAERWVGAGILALGSLLEGALPSGGWDTYPDFCTTCTGQDPGTGGLGQAGLFPTHSNQASPSTRCPEGPCVHLSASVLKGEEGHMLPSPRHLPCLPSQVQPCQCHWPFCPALNAVTCCSEFMRQNPQMANSPQTNGKQLTA